MPHSNQRFQLGVALLAIVAWVGCDTPTKQGAAPLPNGVREHHAGVGHDHGHSGHGHAEEGPHHGHLIELGQEEYHAELVHDEVTKSVTVYLFDASARHPVSIADREITLNLVVDETPRQAKLAATPQEKDPAGESSRFTLVDDELLEALEGPKTSGRLNVTIGGKSYTGAIEHQEHGDHEHN